jgi:hypothetical protein
MFFQFVILGFVLLGSLIVAEELNTQTARMEFILPKMFGNYSEDDLKSAPTCGTQISMHYNTPAYSNGDYQGTGSSCAGCHSVGCFYQCMEFINRYFSYRWKTESFVWPAYANLICDSHPSDVYQTDNPQEGDAMVLNFGDTGHAAIITKVDGDTIWVIEQNGSPTGSNSYSRDSAACFLSSR